MTAAVSAGRHFRRFRSPNDKTRTLPHQRSYEEDEEEGLVDERPSRNRQRSDRNANSHTPSNHSRKRPRSLPPQDSLRHSPYFQQKREPKSEPWSSGQRHGLQTIDSSSTSHIHQERGALIQSPTSNQPPSREYDDQGSNSGRDKMCNTPFRRNFAATYRSRNNHHHSGLRDSNREYTSYNQGEIAPRQQHRLQERNEADFRSDNKGEDPYRAHERGGNYNGNLRARNERGSGYRRGWSDRRAEERKDWGERRPAEMGEYSGSRGRPGNKRDLNEEVPTKQFDRNYSNQYHCQSAHLRTTRDDRGDNDRQDWRARNEQGSRHSGRFNEILSDPLQSRVLQEQRSYRTETLLHQEHHCRNERFQDEGFHLCKSRSCGDSYSKSHMESRTSINEGSRPRRSDDRYLEEQLRPYKNFRNRDQRPPSSLSSQARECNQTEQTHEYRREFSSGNASGNRHQSREYQENGNRSRHGSNGGYLDRNRRAGCEQGRFGDSNPDTTRIDMQQQRQQREQWNRSDEYSTKPYYAPGEKHTPSAHLTSPGYSATNWNRKVVEERTVQPKAPFASMVLKEKEFGVPPKVPNYTSNPPEIKSREASSTLKPAPVAAKPATTSKKIEHAKKSSLCIPMSWLKPKAKPKMKKSTLKTVAKAKSNSEDRRHENKVDAMRIPRDKIEKESGLTISPSQSPSTNRMVTDSEGGSTLSTMKDALGESTERLCSKPKVPSAIVTNPATNPKVQSPEDEMLKSDNDSSVDGTTSDIKPPSVLQASTYSSNDSMNSSTSADSDDSDTDDEEVMMWASKMFGVPFRAPDCSSSGPDGGEEDPSPMKKLRLKLKVPRSQPQPEGAMKDEDRPRKKKRTQKPKRKRSTAKNKESDRDESSLPLKKRKRKSKKRDSIGSSSYAHEETEEERMRKESAKPLTAEQIEAILGEDDFAAPGGSNWVRRSVRQPSKALLNAKPLRMLVEKLKGGDPDMVVLKMKKYINDPNAPSVVLDAALDALEENTNCQSLYIQNFNEGMRDNQVIHLLKILQNPKCNIWCLNIGENYNVKTRTWDKFTKGLKKTKITHMYASEHTITTEMKDEIRSTIRNNRTKHDMHVNPENLHVIVQCTHCWWNPINAKVLRPYLKKEGFEHILADKEAQGLRGSMSAHTLV